VEVREEVVVQPNPVWLAPLLWGVGLAATGGASYWGYRELQSYQQRTQDEMEQRRRAALDAHAEQEARTRQMLTQLNPFMTAGTVVMTGLGVFIMMRGMKRQRARHRRELIAAYRRAQ
jgi:LmbE family N-acetylglucosaminyl deacetylase